MRRVARSVCLMGGFVLVAAHLQPQIAAATSACSVLTKELVLQITPYEKQARDLVMSVPATEDRVGPSGSACSYGGIELQIDPFTPEFFEKQRDKTWISVSDVGDTAYFHDNGGRYAELYVRTGGRVLTIQMDVPTGRSTESIRPNVIALAKAIAPKLR